MESHRPRRIARADPYDRFLVQESLAAIARADQAIRDTDAILERGRVPAGASEKAASYPRST